MLRKWYPRLGNSCRAAWAHHHATTSQCRDYHDVGELKKEYDAVIIGAGHNGLITAAYLQNAGIKTCVLERRHIIGGAAVTEEIFDGFKFSRASYVLSLLRPQIIQELQLKKHGLKVYLRNPNSYTPLINPSGKARSLTLGRDHRKNQEQIAQFSTEDAEAYGYFEAQLDRIATAIQSVLDQPPINIPNFKNRSFRKANISAISAMVKTMIAVGKDFPAFYELMTAPTTKVLNKWFESEPLKATLATDSVIGAMISPQTPGSGYVLLHHVMGEQEGIKGAWGYVEGGMGSVSNAIAKSAVSRGAEVFTNKLVHSILVDDNNSAKGVVLEDGTEVKSKMVLSNATPKVTFLDLLDEKHLPSDVLTDLKNFDYTSPVTKINVALNKLPNFTADPNVQDNTPMPHHQTTIHLNCENTELIHDAYLDAQQGLLPRKPMIEMVIPSSLDPTVAPPGCHVALLFTQYTPYTLANGQTWTEEMKNKYADVVFADIEKYAPGFTASVVGRDILTPPDIESIFGLTGGNIFQGAMGWDQLYHVRPTSHLSGYRSPVSGLYLCGGGTHPGGGVMGTPGRLAAKVAIEDYKARKKS